jgi:RNA polymerase sigma-70 factor (ECF subfamily)
MTQERQPAAFLQLFLLRCVRYLEGVGMTPAQPVENLSAAAIASAPLAVHPVLLEELWRQCDAESWGLPQAEFNRIIRNLNRPPDATTRPQQQAWFAALKLNDLVLAQACAAGNERAWEHFVAMYEQQLIRAAVAITGNDTVGRDLAGQLYAELYGLTEREGQRRSPLASYKGRGSLIGWLRTTLAQRHVDHFRRSRREEPIEDYDAPATEAEAAPGPAELLPLAGAVERALRGEPPEVRFLLASYYLDGRTLAEIACVIRVHEATVSRKLHRAVDGLRKQVLKNLESAGLSRRAAREALGADPRDLDMNLKNLLQNPPSETFQERVAL